MPARPIIDALASLTNETSAISSINTNLNRVADVIPSLLSRSSTTDNAMNIPLDMNNQRILNIPIPVSNTDPARKIDLDTFKTQVLAIIQSAGTTGPVANVAYRAANAVADFGVPTNGTSNCRPAIQTAIDAIAARGGGTLQLPPIRMGIDGPLYARNAVRLEGTGGVPPTGNNPELSGTILYPLAGMSYMITQADMNVPLHTFAMDRVNLDGGRVGGKSVGFGLYVSMIEGRITNLHISQFTGTGLYNKTNSTASWTNWITGNFINRCDTGLNFEGTDSVIADNYISTNRSYNTILNSTGNNAFTSNMLDNAGFDDSNNTANTSAVALLIRNTADYDKGVQYAQLISNITGNRFVSNPRDIGILSDGHGLFGGITITGNTFIDPRGGGSMIDVNGAIDGVNICGNSFRDHHEVSQSVVTFSSSVTSGSVGPNIFINCTSPTRYNVPAGTIKLGFQ